MRSWLWLDLPLILVDWGNLWVAMMTGHDLGTLRLVKLAKSCRILGIMKMIRIVKLPKMWSDIMDQRRRRCRPRSALSDRCLQPNTIPTHLLSGPAAIIVVEKFQTQSTTINACFALPALHM